MNILSDLEIRTIHEHELSALVELYQHLHPTDASLPHTEQLNLVWSEIVTDPKLRCFVVEWEGKLIASCVLVIVPNLTRGARPYGLIENVVTHIAYRGQGIGTKLLQHALQTAWRENCYKVMLLTGSKSEATHRFYEEAGFKKGIKTGFVAVPGV